MEEQLRGASAGLRYSELATVSGNGEVTLDKSNPEKLVGMILRVNSLGCWNC